MPLFHLSAATMFQWYYANHNNPFFELVKFTTPKAALAHFRCGHNSIRPNFTHEFKSKVMKNLIYTLAAVLFTTICFGQNEEWDDYFMPGAGYKMFVPKNRSDLGTYHGFTTEFVIYARAKGSDSKYWSGPGRIKTYGNLSIMGSDNAVARDIFFVNAGLNLSFESNIKRKFLIPYFGLEMGGLFQRDFSSMHFTPVAGIQLLSTKRVIWSVQGGYLYTTKRFDEYSGYSFSSTLNILLWND